MDGRFSSPFLIKQEDSENSAENSEDSPRACMFNDNKIASTSSPKRSTSTRRAIQKRVVCVPIKDVDGSRLKGEVSSPPSDSWAWRKYGQKPIKGSPYPRGYYRCSSSKGCPARKQVERSRDDPHMLVVTYSCEHNHPWPTSRNNRHNNTSSVVATPTPTTTTTTTSSKSEEEKVENLSMQQEEINSEAKFSNLGEAKFSNLGETHEFGWLSDFECTSSTMLENPILSIEERVTNHAEMNMFCSMREEDESLFADLGELPEYSMVFRHGMIERDEERQGQSMTPWCGTIG